MQTGKRGIAALTRLSGPGPKRRKRRRRRPKEKIMKKDYYLQMAIVHDRVATGYWSYQEAINYIDNSNIPATKVRELINDICELDRQNRKRK
jgi:hypothetical protein